MNNNFLKETNHTFAICAYKESDYLEECIISVMNQKTPSNVQITTSTPNDFINGLADKYNLTVIINENENADMQENWNFAVSQVSTDYVTICHQDDYYYENYFETIQKQFNENILMIHTGYCDVVDGTQTRSIPNKIKSLIMSPMKKESHQNSKFFKKFTLSFGNTICCPSCTYNLRTMTTPLFLSKLKHACDWDLFIDLAFKPGRVVYVPDVLTCKRIHDTSATKNDILSGLRNSEDYYLFSRLWPKPIAFLLSKLIKKIYKYG